MIANSFRISQIRQKLEREWIHGKENANQQIQREEQQHLEQGPQLFLFSQEEE